MDFFAQYIFLHNFVVDKLPETTGYFNFLKCEHYNIDKELAEIKDIKKLNPANLEPFGITELPVKLSNTDNPFKRRLKKKS